MPGAALLPKACRAVEEALLLPTALVWSMVWWFGAVARGRLALRLSIRERSSSPFTPSSCRIRGALDHVWHDQAFELSHR